MKKDKTAHQINQKGDQRLHSHSNRLHHFNFLPEFFRSLLLSFSPALDEHNPDIPEWRDDIGRVVRTALSQVHQFPIALKSSVAPTTATSGFQGHYYFIAECSTDTAVMLFYGPCGNVCLFFSLLLMAVTRHGRLV